MENTSTPESSNGIAVEPARLLAIIHDRIDEAKKLEAGAQKAKAERLYNAIDSLVSALLSMDIRNRSVTLPEAVRPFYDLLHAKKAGPSSGSTDPVRRSTRGRSRGAGN